MICVWQSFYWLVRALRAENFGIKMTPSFQTHQLLLLQGGGGDGGGDGGGGVGIQQRRTCGHFPALMKFSFHSHSSNSF
jgi:hypothetical protein